MTMKASAGNDNMRENYNGREVTVNGGVKEGVAGNVCLAAKNALTRDRDVAPRR